MAEQQRDLVRTIFGILAIGGLMAASFLVLRPFMVATVWAMTLVIATWPAMIGLQNLLGGRRALAVTLMTVALLLIVVLPVFGAIIAIVEHSERITTFVTALPGYRLPAPPAWLSDIPMIGGPAMDAWQRWADSAPADIARMARPYVGTITRWFVGAAGSAGGLVVHLLLTIAIAALLYATGERAAAWSRRFGRRLADERGEASVVLAGQAIRSVALGVVVTALAQTVVAGLGLLLASVPGAGVLTAVILILCIAQLGPALVLIPATIWLFVSGATIAGVVLAVTTVIALTMDNVLRPFLIKRGADLPLLLILAGVIGGLLSFGPLGLFLGPVVLAVSYTLLEHWMAGPASPGAAAPPR